MRTLIRTSALAAALVAAVSGLGLSATAAGATEPAPSPAIASVAPDFSVSGLLQGPTTDVVGKGAEPGAVIRVSQYGLTATGSVGQGGYWSAQLPLRPFGGLPATGRLEVTQIVDGEASAPLVYVVPGFEGLVG